LRTGVVLSTLSPAERAGLKCGDIITEYDGCKLEREVRLSVIRDGKPVTLSARIEALDAKESAQADGGEKAKPALGLAVQPLTPALAQQMGVSAKQGLVVQSVQGGSPAADVGFERGDVIVEVVKRPVKSLAELRESVDKRASRLDRSQGLLNISTLSLLFNGLR
jgi:serine protease Do